MADNFGLKIGLEGEKEFKDALRDINQSFKVMGSEMNLVASEFDKQDQSIEAVTARNKVLGKEIDTQKEKIGVLEQALANASSSFGENDKRTQAWAVQLNNAKADLNNLEKELDQNNKSLDSASDEFKTAEKQAGDFGTEVKKSAAQAEEAWDRFEKLGGILKGIGVGLAAGVAGIGTAAVAAGKALTDMSVSAASYADDIMTMSTVTGMSKESLQAYKYAADLVDTSLETLTGSMAKQVKSMSSARDGNKSMAAAYKELGVSVADSHGKLRDGEAVYWETIDALGKVSDETERNALAMKIFGKSAEDLNPLIAQGSAGIAALTNEAKNMGAVMSDDAISKLGAFDDTLQRLKSGSEAAKNALGMVLLPQLQILGGDGVGLLGKFTKGLNDAGGDWGMISGVISGTIGELTGKLVEVLPKFISLGLDIVNAIASAIVQNLPVIVTSAVSIVMTLLSGLIGLLPMITDGALQLVLTLANGLLANLPAILEAAIQVVVTLALGIAQALPQLIPAVVNTVVLLVQTLLANMDKILDAALQIILGLVNGLLIALPQLIAALPQIILAIVDFIIKAIPQIIDAGIQLLTSLIGALPTIITAVVEAIPQIINGIITAVINSIPQLIDAGIKLLVALIQALPQIIVTIVKAIPQIVFGLVDAIVGNIDKIIMAGVQLFVSLIENLPTIIIEIVKAVPQIITGIVDAIGSYVSKLSEAGGNLIKGLWKGISDAGAWLWDKISSFFGDVVDKIKDFFGIHSPSTVFAGIGANLGQGIGSGFEKAMRSVSKDMQNAIPTQFDIDARLRSKGTVGGLSQGTTVNQSISVVTPKPLSEKELAREFRNLSRKLALEL